ncbi:odorant receptor 13a-like [Vespula squamosa]|uniref:Odorant receptor 13a-like n=1 Tax=Vespula squamosa TaxID=30214 RepID=A0ABD2BY29_VESSQ
MSDESSTFGNNVIAVNIFLLKFCGVLPYKTTFVINLDWTNLLAVISFLSLTTYSVSYTYEFVVHMSHADTALEFFSMIISLIGGQARYVILFLKRDKFRKMLKICERLWILLDNNERSCVRIYTNKTKRLTYYYLFGCAFTIFFYAIASLFVSSSANNTNGNETSVRSLPYAFIFDIHDSPYFEIAYVYQLSTMINVGLTCVGADTVGPVMILIACGHLKVIQNKMSSMMEDKKSVNIEADDGEDSYISQDVKIKLNSYVNYHCTILEFCKDIEELANVIFLTQLIGSTYNISLVGFKLAGVRPPALYPPLLPPSLPLPSPPPPLPPPSPPPLSVNYIYGSLQDDPDKYKYTTQTAAIANSAFSMPWYMYSTELKRSMHIIIMRSQKAVRLTAGKFAYLSLETFASVIKSPQCGSHNKEIPRSEGVGDDTGTRNPRRRLKGQRGVVKVVVGVGLGVGIGKRGWGQGVRIGETRKELPMSNEQERKEDSLLFARHLR